MELSATDTAQNSLRLSESGRIPRRSARARVGVARGSQMGKPCSQDLRERVIAAVDA